MRDSVQKDRKGGVLTMANGLKFVNVFVSGRNLAAVAGLSLATLLLASCIHKDKENPIYPAPAPVWTTIPTPSGLSPRGDLPSVWDSVGRRLFVWGGAQSPTAQFSDGAIFTVGPDTWTPMGSNGAPTGRSSHGAVWTGTEYIVWGGFNGVASQPVIDYFSDGARYNPDTQTWTPMSGAGAPSGRAFFGCVWTGSKMLVWGGLNGLTALGDGAAYDPSNDTWTPIALGGAPSARSFIQDCTVWTGSRMMIVGGSDDSWNGGTAYQSGGGSYDPVTDTWATIPDAPISGRDTCKAVWTGSSLLLWGGYQLGGSYANDGAIYNPGTSSWTSMTTANAPTGRVWFNGAWSGTKFQVFGGYVSPGFTYTGDGGSYDLATDTWEALPAAGAPSARAEHVAVYDQAGGRLIIWGGFVGHDQPVNDGFRFGRP
jgi:hypothetical protein